MVTCWLNTKQQKVTLECHIEDHIVRSRSKTSDSGRYKLRSGIDCKVCVVSDKSSHHCMLTCLCGCSTGWTYGATDTQPEATANCSTALRKRNPGAIHVYLHTGPSRSPLHRQRSLCSCLYRCGAVWHESQLLPPQPLTLETLQKIKQVRESTSLGRKQQLWIQNPSSSALRVMFGLSSDFQTW